MGKLLDAIASQLSIRSMRNEGSSEGLTVETKGYVYQDVSEEIRNLFKKEFNRHMYRKLRQINKGESIEYMFDCGTERPLSLLMDDANDNLAEVFNKLPQLPEGEVYAFPPNSYISITLRAKMGRRMHIKINLVSDVFVKAGL